MFIYVLILSIGILQCIQEEGPLQILKQVVDYPCLFKKVMSFFGKIKNGIDKGVTSLRNSKIFKKKERKETNENEPEITDTDIAIAKLKSEKRNINELLRKVLVD